MLSNPPRCYGNANTYNPFPVLDHQKNDLGHILGRVDTDVIRYRKPGSSRIAANETLVVVISGSVVPPVPREHSREPAVSGARPASRRRPVDS